jgi:hypothetical protein
VKRQSIEIIHEGKYAAEVPVELIDEDGGWSPYLSVEDVRKLERVRRALRDGDLKVATKWAKVYELKPVAVAAE